MGKEKAKTMKQDYLDYAMAAEDATTAEKAKAAKPILAAKLKAKIAALDARILEKESEIEGKQADLKKAKGKITFDIDVYMTGVLNAQDAIEAIEGQIEELIDLKADLEKLAKLF